jgi:hypothetical protein
LGTALSAYSRQPFHYLYYTCISSPSFAIEDLSFI